jgi:hypothetical protein
MDTFDDDDDDEQQQQQHTVLLPPAFMHYVNAINIYLVWF